MGYCSHSTTPLFTSTIDRKCQQKKVGKQEVDANLKKVHKYCDTKGRKQEQMAIICQTSKKAGAHSYGL